MFFMVPNWVLAQSQDMFQGLYPPEMVNKLKFRQMRLTHSMDFGKTAENAQGLSVVMQETYGFDSIGRPKSYLATNSSLVASGTAGPHLHSYFEYSEDGNTCHRHDSTIFGNISEWHHVFNTKGQPVAMERWVQGRDTVSFKHDFVYDISGKLQKERMVTFRQEEGMEDECQWNFFVKDNQSFRSLALSPKELSDCECNMLYLNEEGQLVRKVTYDSLGNIFQVELVTYDRTRKPTKIEVLGNDGKTVWRSAQIYYGKDGIVLVEISGEGDYRQREMALLARQAQEIVLKAWPSWRKLNGIDFKQGEKIYASISISYE